MTRTVNVSERVYGILSYGAEAYNESMGKFLERFLDAMCEREKAKELFTHVELKLRRNTQVVYDAHSDLIKEGLSLIVEFSQEKAKELEESLKEIRRQNTHTESENKLVN